MLVYNGLRQISDWALLCFHSEVCVLGESNVPQRGPLIICSNHANEIIDVATLAATIPHRRQVSFWAKSSMFKNVVSRFIMISSGTIPVQRNPNNVNTGAETSGSSSSASGNTSVFSSSLSALTGSRVIGVFPEGTSYTEHRIMQVKEGAARVALEYCSLREREGSMDGNAMPQLTFIPVGIMHTDKSQYQSRMLVQYGEPINLDEYIQEYCSPVRIVSRAAVARLNSELERRLFGLTVNAPDWDTLHMSRIAEEIIWPDQQLPLVRARDMSQTLVDIFSMTMPTPRAIEAKSTLLQYAGLLHYADISHSALAPSLPRIQTMWASTSPSLIRSVTTFLSQLCITLQHPRFLLSCPVFFLHLPAYTLARFAGRYLADPRLDEAISQYKIIFGGLGMGLSYAGLTSIVVKWMRRVGDDRVGGIYRWEWVNKVLDVVGELGRVTEAGEDWFRWSRSVLAIGVIAYGVAWVSAKWHNAMILSNYRQYKRLRASFRILVSNVLPSSPLSSTDPTFEAYFRPPYPPLNPYVTYPQDSNVYNRPKPAAPVAFWRLMPLLLSARRKAVLSLVEYLKEVEGMDPGPGVSVKASREVIAKSKELAKEMGVAW